MNDRPEPSGTPSDSGRAGPGDVDGDAFGGDAAHGAVGVAAAERPASKDLFRRLLAFQFKLLIDGLRDVILSPASIIAVLVGVFGEGPADRPFRALLRFGRRTDAWIDLFDAHEEDDGEARQRPETSANALFDAVERAVREEYERGGGRAGIEARLRGLRERSGGQ